MGLEPSYYFRFCQSTQSLPETLFTFTAITSTSRSSATSQTPPNLLPLQSFKLFSELLFHFSRNLNQFVSLPPLKIGFNFVIVDFSL
ncbi:hypothetical protein FF1_030904 [Malus domestica]